MRCQVCRKELPKTELMQCPWCASPLAETLGISTPTPTLTPEIVFQEIPRTVFQPNAKPEGKWSDIALDVLSKILETIATAFVWGCVLVALVCIGYNFGPVAALLTVVGYVLFLFYRRSGEILDELRARNERSHDGEKSGEGREVQSECSDS